MLEALNTGKLEYTGNIQPKSGEQDIHGQPLYPYLPSPELVEAVNLAIYLERPLLLKGQPGCGKTQLARAVSYELGLEYEPWYIKSTSTAKEGLYTYDSVSRLRDAQLVTSNRLSPEQWQQLDERLNNPEGYVTLGALGKALCNDNRTVVLIDEIDKADIDFPNDLLRELDEKAFTVTEIDKPPYRAKSAPIIFITSNDEKELSDAFLRRCLFHYVEFPDSQQLVTIVKSHFPGASDKIVKAATQRFWELRMKMEDRKDSGKVVSTSELLDWFKVLRRYKDDEILKKLDGKLPFASVLLKNWDDHIRYVKQGSDRE